VQTDCILSRCYLSPGDRMDADFMGIHLIF
jgi:hypothetical protein